MQTRINKFVDTNCEKESNMSINQIERRFIGFAFAIILLFSMTAPVYAVDPGNIEDYLLPSVATAGSEIDKNDPEKRAAISLVGRRGTPEYNAYVEWTAYLEGAEEPDHSAPEMEDAWYETADNYALFYDATTQERSEVLDEIVKRNDVSLHTARAVFNNGEIQKLYDALEMEPFISGVYDVMGGYFYDDGSFNLQAERFGDDFDTEDDFELYMFTSVKGSFSMISSFISTDYDEWPYATVSGEDVDLVLDNGSGIILFETKGAYIYIRASIGQPDARQHISRDDLEAFADTIDFAALAERFNGLDHDDTTQKAVYLYEQQQAASLRSDIEQRKPFASISERDDYIFDKLGDWQYPAALTGYSCRNTSTFYMDGNALGWDGEPLYSDGVTRAYMTDDGNGMYLRYERFYSSASRAETENNKQFNALTELYPNGTACTVSGYEAWYVPQLMDGPHSALFWLDTSKDLVFSLEVMDDITTEEVLSALAKEIVQSVEG